MGNLILLRHGKSAWNKKNLFTGWVDIPLCDEGIEEALAAGAEIKEEAIDVVFTSTLERGVMTAMLALSDHGSRKVPVILHKEGRLEQWGHFSDHAKEEVIPVYKAWELNERMYGDLQGKNKDEIKAEFGEEQFMLWRRSFETPPPHGESLKMTAERTLPFFDQVIVPYLKEGKSVLISAHGNSLRSIVMELEALSEEEVVSLEIPTGKPLYYTYEEGTFKTRA